MSKGDLTDAQWLVVEGVLPEDRVRADGRGRPWSDRRKVLNGVLWILRTGAPWQDLPARYGPYQTAVSKLGARWSDRDSADGPGGSPQRSRGTGPQRILYGRKIRSGKTRGLYVGK